MRRDAGVRRRRAKRASISIRRASCAPSRPRARLGLEPRAVIPVDLFGQPADHDAIAAVAAAPRTCSCSTMPRRPSARPTRTAGSARSRRRRRPASSRPSRSAATATAARCFTDDDELADAMRSLRVHGEGRDKYDCVRIGMNGRLDTIQAAVLIEKLKIFPEEIAARERVARALFRGARRCRDRCRSVARRLDLGVGAIHHPARAPAGATRSPPRSRRRAFRPRSTIAKPLHRQAAYRHFPVADGGVPVSERLAEEVISLPMHAYLDEPTQDRIIAAVRRARWAGLKDRVPLRHSSSAPRRTAAAMIGRIFTVGGFTLLSRLTGFRPRHRAGGDAGRRAGRRRLLRRVAAAQPFPRDLRRGRVQRRLRAGLCAHPPAGRRPIRRDCSPTASSRCCWRLSSCCWRSRSCSRRR